MMIGPKNMETTFFPQRNELHLARKLWHILSGLSVIFVYYTAGWDGMVFAYGTLILAIVSFTSEALRLKIPAYNRFVMQKMRIVMRESEKNSVSGLPFYALGCSLSIFFFEEKIAILAILFLVFSDPLSSIAGILYGKHQLIKNKSLEGSCAGFIVCYILALAYGLFWGAFGLGLLGFSLLAGLVGSLSELVSINIDDNLVIPVVSGFGLTLLNEIFHIF